MAKTIEVGDNDVVLVLRDNTGGTARLFVGDEQIGLVSSLDAHADVHSEPNGTASITVRFIEGVELPKYLSQSAKDSIRRSMTRLAQCNAARVECPDLGTAPKDGLHVEQDGKVGVYAQGKKVGAQG